MGNRFVQIGTFAFSTFAVGSAYAGTMSAFNAINPLPHSYSEGVDYVINSGSRNVEITGKMSSAGEGCSASDFAGIASGAIVTLPKTDTCSPSVQMGNAKSAGAAAVIFVQYEILDGPILKKIDFGSTPTIPSISIMYGPDVWGVRNQNRASLEIISPNGSNVPVEFEDYMGFQDSKLGDAEANVFKVANLGCDPGDYVGLAVGDIALINRGTCAFGAKAEYAYAAGASAAMIANNVPTSLINGVLASFTLLPTLTISQELGAYFSDLSQTSNLRVAMSVSAPSNSYYLMIQNEVPEPATLALFGLGCVGFGLMRRRKRSDR